ncbi:hypothetical protein NW762_012107 [Fusarium torreyae]|uniref:Uncharacterized protein n=1 Tax=Fusarium torreyae TaxID=1237075 RepID=A0A9W8V8M6_9HYPO|nr:hypothetical protein NW762_012107 [Fusarium torreyae]
MSLNESLDSTSIYISLKSRPTPGEYHWGLILTDSNSKPVLHHATNIKGPWAYETLHDDAASPMSLIALMKVGNIENYSLAEEIVQKVPADGSPSWRTGESFTCRIWVKDALVELHENGLTRLPVDIDTIESKTIEYGLILAPLSETGNGPIVVSDSFGS